MANDGQKADITGLSKNYCSSDTFGVAIFAKPSGGVFTGNGISNNRFYPNKAGKGEHIITYKWFSGNCEYSTEKKVTIIEAPKADSIILDKTSVKRLCKKDPNSYELLISPLPSPEIKVQFSGVGVELKNGRYYFKPGKVKSGETLIYSTLTNANTGCKTSISTKVTIVEDMTLLGNVTFINKCKNDSVILTISGANYYDWTPSYNLSCHPYCQKTQKTTIFTNVKNKSDITVIGYMGLYTKKYTFSIKNEKKLAVLKTPTYLCFSNSQIALSALPEGGKWSGKNVLDGIFNIGLAGVGNHTITYQWEESNCVRETTWVLKVDKSEPIVLFNLKSEYCRLNHPVKILTSQVGGKFSGTGISGNIFDPLKAGLGVHTIKYEGVAKSGCNYIIEKLVTVTQPDVNFTLPASVCIKQPSIYLSARPPGGKFYGKGVIGNLFYPSKAGYGTTTVMYAGESVGCSYSSTKAIKVISCGREESISLDNLPEISLYPNPSNGNFELSYYSQSNLNLNLNVIIYDLTGRVIKNLSFTIIEGFNKFSIDMNNESAGVYLLQAQQAERVNTVKIVIQ